MEDVREENATLLVYDHDKTIAKCHTNGMLFQRPFEKPYAANLRAFVAFRQHLQLLQKSENPRVILATATFGEFRERIVGSWEALGINQDSILICAKFVKVRLARLQGKNEHIARLIQQHYERHPHIRITRVVLADDDLNNIDALRSYYSFIKMPPWSDDHRLDVPVEGVLVPPPRMATEGTDPAEEMMQTHFDRHLEVEVCTEMPESQWRFLCSLKTIEEKVGIKRSGSDSRCSAFHFSAQPAPKQRPLFHPLTHSLDETVLIELKHQPLKEIGNLDHSGDAWKNSSCDSLKISSFDPESESSGEENMAINKRDLLFRSMP